MAIQNEPTRISTPFADAGTKNVIPETMAQPSATAAASWQAGFPTVCSLPLSAGGIPPARNDFNGIFNQLSQTARFMQDGGVYEWDSDTDYGANRIVLGSDGALYWSVAQSGPGTGAGAINPTTDSGAYWTIAPVLKGKKILDLVLQGLSISGDTSYPATRPSASLQFSDVNDAGVAFLNVKCPSSAEKDFRVEVGLDAISTYAGDTYGGSPVLVLVTKPNNIAFVDTYYLKTHASQPLFVLESQGAPQKGTPPSSNRYSQILFCDSDDDKSFGGGNNRYGGIQCLISNNGSDSLVLQSFKNEADSTVNASVSLTIHSNGSKLFNPASDGDIQMGASNVRWGQIYSTSSTISTSDARLKTTPEAVPDAVLDAWGDVGFVQFQMLDSVAQKGADSARLHSGLVAQRIDEAFKAHGLDARRYGLFCWDEWDAEPEQRDENGAVVQEAREGGERYSLRYEEALCMEAAYQRRRADRAEARIAALEERLVALEARLV